MNKKGFTLIELLAVIVILAIIALIAVPVILNMIENARRSAAKSSAYGYIDAIDNNNKLAGMKNNDMDNIPDVIDDGTYEDVTSIGIKIKGKKPTSGSLTITNGKVSNATNLCFYNYPVSYNGTVATVGNKGCSGSGSSSGPKSLTPQTDVAGPTTVVDGTELYFDPVSTAKCDSTTFDLEKIKNNQSTCYKWNIINREGNNLTVQLDHNLINKSKWATGDYTSTGPNKSLSDLATSTSSWNRVPSLNYTYDTTLGGTNNGNHYGVLSCVYGTCKITGNNTAIATNVKVRMITGEEVNALTVRAGASSTSLAATWTLKSDTNNANYFSNSGYTIGTRSRGAGSTTLSWMVNNTTYLYDSGASDNDYGENNDGYMTLSPLSTGLWSESSIWRVGRGGNITELIISNNTYGIRPVITLPKCVFDNNKCSGWHLINPDMQAWSYYNNGEIIQNGWGRGLLDLSGKVQDYYFESGTAVKGWKTIDNKKYYFSETDSDNNGYIDFNKVYGGNIEINGTTYTFDNNGVCTSSNC